MGGMVKAIPKGMVDAASIIFFIFILGGAFEMVQSTGAIDAIVVKFINKLKNKEKLVIPLLMFLFSVLGFTIGASEEMIAFVPITIMIARGFGFDNIVGGSNSFYRSSYWICRRNVKPIHYGCSPGHCTTSSLFRSCV